MFSPKAKRHISRIIPIGIIWLVFSIVYSQLEKGILGDLKQYPVTGNPYNFTSAIFINAVTALVTGLVIGALEVMYFHELFRKKTLTQKIIYKTATYLVSIMGFLLLLTVVNSLLEMGVSILQSTVWIAVGKFVFSYAFLSVVIYIGVINVVIQFYTEISDHIGSGVLRNLITGKYHRPQEEERIFMFLDMKSSTTIAENIGHVRYFEMLSAYYNVISDPIIDYSGEVYQYVGDEIVVSWPLAAGLKNNNCILCFYSMKDALQKQEDMFNGQFGLLPGFKAAFHTGKVTTGEIGTIKKDIIFTGDVMNTTSRIQGLCNTYKVDVLVSDALMKKLTLSTEFRVESVGKCDLRGKEERIELYTLFRG